MRACPAGNGKGACACSSDQVTNIRLWPSPREDIGATLEPITGPPPRPKRAFAMSLTFNLALEAYGIEPRKVRLLRHHTRGNNGQTPYTLWRDNRPLFEAYQAAQSTKNRNRLASAIWASFVVTPDGRTLFAGLYAVQGVDDVPDDWEYPLSARPADGDDDLYRLDHIALFSDFDGRLYVDWGPGTRTWVQRADQQDKPIEEFARRFAEPPFPGFSAFNEPLSRITGLPPTWITALGAARGIYLLTCPRTNELYVGSATGTDGFIGRWRDYALTGHGGNVVLKSRDASDYQVSILEVAGSLDATNDIVALETRWKNKLQSRAMGLNAN